MAIVRALSAESSAHTQPAPNPRLERGSGPSRCHAAQVCGVHHARAVLVSVACWLGVFVPLGTSSAAEPMPSQPQPSRSGYSADLRLSAGGAAAHFSQHDSRLAELDAFSVSAALRLGGFVNPRVLLGYELLVGRHTDIGTPSVRDPREFGELRRHDGYTIISPLGAFVELYPHGSAGFYLGASASVGLIAMPALADADGAVMGGYALELGYDMSHSGKQGLGGFLRYSRWAGLAPFSDHGDELDAYELALGARWSLY